MKFHKASFGTYALLDRMSSLDLEALDLYDPEAAGDFLAEAYAGETERRELGIKFRPVIFVDGLAMMFTFVFFDSSLEEPQLEDIRRAHDEQDKVFVSFNFRDEMGAALEGAAGDEDEQTPQTRIPRLH
jgi:hypothetical protein